MREVTIDLYRGAVRLLGTALLRVLLILLTKDVCWRQTDNHQTQRGRLNRLGRKHGIRSFESGGYLQLFDHLQTAYQQTSHSLADREVSSLDRERIREAQATTDQVSSKASRIPSVLVFRPGDPRPYTRPLRSYRPFSGIPE